MDGQELLEEFKRARRETQKLELALEIFRPGQVMTEEEKAPFVNYLVWRKRPAVLYLIQRGDLVRLRELYKAGWLEPQYLENYRDLAISCRETEIWSWLVLAGDSDHPENPAASEVPVQLLSEKLPAETESDNKKAENGNNKSADRNNKMQSYDAKGNAESETSGANVQIEAAAESGEQRLCGKIWKLTLKNLRMKLPGLSEILGTLSFRADSGVEYLSCDGFTVFYEPSGLMERYRRHSSGLERDLLHIILHNMYLHPVLVRDREERHWNLACDLTVEAILDSWKLKGLERAGADFRSYQLKELHLPRRWNGVESIYKTLMEQYPSMEKLCQLEELNHIDDHSKWGKYREKEEFHPESQSRGEGEAGPGEGTAFIRKWDRLRKEWNPQMGQEHDKAGNQAGVGIQKTPVRQKKEYDYRNFLQQFMVCQEEVELDLDSIDYLPYWYSRNHYKDIVLIEPLEYKEVHKLDEMVIAIDTSGSCSGKVVRRFLEETWSILTESGNFFKKMHVHIIQCDSMIQEHVVIRSRDEFQDYMDDVTVKGLGGTDFRPVFELVQKLTEEKQLLNLKALLYFTDGDGVYPKEKPPYQTAFIFLNKAYEKQKIPDWAIRLNLGLQLEE